MWNLQLHFPMRSAIEAILYKVLILVKHYLLSRMRKHIYRLKISDYTIILYNFISPHALYLWKNVLHEKKVWIISSKYMDCVSSVCHYSVWLGLKKVSFLSRSMPSHFFLRALSLYFLFWLFLELNYQFDSKDTIYFR